MGTENQRRGDTAGAYPLPEGIPTSLTIGEMRLLQHYAHEAGTVLEIGTYYGYSCIGMALAGAYVTSVDPHRPDASATRGTGAPYEDTWEPFLANVARHGFDVAPSPWPDMAGGEHVWACRLPIEDWHRDAPAIAPYGLVFIDGDHMHPAPIRDASIALAHLRAPGYVAFHDVTPVWMDVWLTVRELERTGELVKLAQERYLAVYQAAAYTPR